MEAWIRGTQYGVVPIHIYVYIYIIQLNVKKIILNSIYDFIVVVVNYFYSYNVNNFKKYFLYNQELLI